MHHNSSMLKPAAPGNLDIFQIARCSRDRSRLDPIPGSRLTTIASKGILWRDRGSGFALSNIQIEKTVYDKRSTSDGKRILRSEEHTSELQSPYDLVCRLLLE